MGYKVYFAFIFNLVMTWDNLIIYFEQLQTSFVQTYKHLFLNTGWL